MAHTNPSEAPDLALKEAQRLSGERTPPVFLSDRHSDGDDHPGHDTGRKHDQHDHRYFNAGHDGPPASANDIRSAGCLPRDTLRLALTTVSPRLDQTKPRVETNGTFGPRCQDVRPGRLVSGGRGR